MSVSCDKPVRILLVDDKPTNLKMLSDVLKGNDWTMLVATDGVSAIEQAQYAQPSLILLDVMMPGIDGFETCQRLKTNAKTKAIPIIFMTALSNSDYKVRGLEMGAVDYITKPFQQKEVIARVKLHLHLKFLAQELEEKNKLLTQEITEKTVAESRLQQLAQELEHRVEQRTAELSDSLNKLQQAQLQLVQSEKMSALGNLVAGIAHELNNPISFLQGNLGPLQEYIQDLLALVEAYQKTFPEPGQAIQEQIETIEWDFLRQDLEKILSSWFTGMERIHNISDSLRTFSRADKEHKVLFNVHEGLDSTLLILRHRLKANETRPEIEVKRHYQNIPEIECFAGQLNQVFMNLLANAIDTLDDVNQSSSCDMGQSRVNLITVSTGLAVNSNNIVIKIEDNGAGMDEAIKPRIFDHLFTTKEVGRGTGLGLAIVWQIVVDKHGGSIDVTSTLGQGTCFTLMLPLQSGII
ncbi:hybrid sensor histidine kinase/response regulator [Leptolyngbyaceae cyanobacterium CCMR0082]|uniref:histidine kinase n=1 Tax=Adonisia turfae CCMR0082 TaxID=2304604 RepID=A0A6M0SBG8_9CYAN|nr:hybrid sensor histidine kinase/response regulator [Adonisia turfae]NEZ65835.1 hybrid sensor histidine kinase/response regulator [Adonisia turfae CCMR0082]